MAEVSIVDAHPNGCVACQAVTGPFVVMGLAGWTVNTVNGPFQVDTDIVLCAKRDGREGCAGQIARIAGYTSPDELENVQRQHADLLEKHAALEQEHQELELAHALDRKELAKEIAEQILAEAG